MMTGGIELNGKWMAWRVEWGDIPYVLGVPSRIWLTLVRSGGRRPYNLESRLVS
jgi:hypothetical protein